MSELQDKINKRRTFAIISHPDAGKTTLTEKLLLYGGAIHLAGSVKSRKTNRHAVSDWMEIEKQRGISVTSSVLQFDYDGYRVNILDTPGHQDFSEDTYRTLIAADSAVMLIDAAKGVEPQTKNSFGSATEENCRSLPLSINWTAMAGPLWILWTKSKRSFILMLSLSIGQLGLMGTISGSTTESKTGGTL